ncbi:Krueppel-like factor 14 isoform X1 [Panicum virgatum]|uniref:Krueppel-like factor 14 isoform X1 n=1 Tax=Panicum virgatum TaxID=38727 RepID=UPI0019D61AB7|nr:Krueppel-like factor 14 isoform X1 [Panicum virgatum]
MAAARREASDSWEEGAAGAGSTPNHPAPVLTTLPVAASSIAARRRRRCAGRRGNCSLPAPSSSPPAAAAPTAGGGHSGVGTGSTPLPSSDGAPSSRPRSASPFQDRGEPRAAAMSKVFEGCERQYCVAAASLSRKCTAASALDGEKEAKAVRDPVRRGGS